MTGSMKLFDFSPMVTVPGLGGRRLKAGQGFCGDQTVLSMVLLVDGWMRRTFLLPVKGGLY